jgi:DNA-binding Lrp family transcriptional regulator
MSKAKKILTALQDHINVKNFKQLAEYLGISEKLIYSWVRHDKISGTGKILAKIPYINLDWLETGQGPMMIIDKDNFHLLPQNQKAENNGYVRANIIARIEPGNPDIKQLLTATKAEEKKKAGEEKQPSVEEMVDMTKVVLNSQTVYRSALASNVRAFYQAVVNEGELKMLSDEIAEIRQANREMKESQIRIEEMLRSLGAVEQKRDSAA